MSPLFLTPTCVTTLILLYKAATFQCSSHAFYDDTAYKIQIQIKTNVFMMFIVASVF